VDRSDENGAQVGGKSVRSIATVKLGESVKVMEKGDGGQDRHWVRVRVVKEESTISRTIVKVAPPTLRAAPVGALPYQKQEPDVSESALDKKALQGSWKFMGFEREGRYLSEEVIRMHQPVPFLKLNFAGDECFEVKTVGKASYLARLSYTLHTMSTLKTIELKPQTKKPAGPGDADPFSPAVSKYNYTIRGDQLTLTLRIEDADPQKGPVLLHHHFKRQPDGEVMPGYQAHGNNDGLLPVAKESWANKLFDAMGPTTHDFGKVARGTELVHRFRLKNIYNVPLEITNLRTSCGCVKVALSPNSQKPNRLQPNEIGYLEITMDSRRFSGPKTAHVFVTIGNDYVSTATLRVSANAHDLDESALYHKEVNRQDPTDPGEVSVRDQLAVYYLKLAEVAKGKMLAAKDDEAKAFYQGTRQDWLEKGAKAYQKLAVELEHQSRDSPLSPTEVVLLRKAHFGEADLLFDMNDFCEALRRYQVLQEKYRKHVEGLFACQRIRKCVGVMVSPPEQARLAQNAAADAVKKAQEDLEAMPADSEVFRGGVGVWTKDNWARWLLWCQG
jgi:hypothetical protein